MRDHRFISCLGGLLSLFLAAQAQAAPAGRIVFLSDFGTIDDAVSQCKAAIFREYPEAQIVDMTHQIPPDDVRLASFLLANAAKVWPAGTVFLAVVDPGVGSSRRPIVVETKSGHFFVGPDNGIFTLPIKSLGLRRAVALTAPADVTTTFHGRDVFAPAAGRLLKSPEALASMGAEVRDPFVQDWEAPKKASGTASGRVLHVEKPFGNVWTDIGPETLQETEILPGSTVQVRIGGKDLSVLLVRTFSDVPKGRALAYFNSRGLFSLALNMDDFAGKFGVESGNPVSVAPSETALVDVRALAGDRVSFDIKYATPKNFTGMKVYPSERCYLRRDAAASLLRAAEL
ncbi:MAG: SAM-dependent chlorinase/fluorinase, partial [candidate division NC10 bacterium]